MGRRMKMMHELALKVLYSPALPLNGLPMGPQHVAGSTRLIMMRFLNKNHTLDEVTKLLKMFVSLIAKKKLKMDPILIGEVVVTLFEHYPKFVNHVSMEEVKALMKIVEDTKADHAQIPMLKDGNIVGAIL
nr:uncharacterized protein LOC109155341 [Ipomoea batatas]